MKISLHPRTPDYEHPDHYWRGFEQFDWPTLLPDIMTRYVWSGCIWDGGRRSKAAFREASWAVLDFDSPLTSIADITKRVCDMIHVIGTTKSHLVMKGGVCCDRFRVALAFERTVTSRSEYEATMRSLIADHGADRACCDAARFFWPCQKILSVCLDIDAYQVPIVVPKVRPAHIERSTEEYASMPLSPLAFYVHKYGLGIGQNRNDKCWSVCYELVKKGWGDSQIYDFVFLKVSSEEGFDEDEKRKILRSARGYASRRGSEKSPSKTHAPEP